MKPLLTSLESRIPQKYHDTSTAGQVGRKSPACMGMVPLARRVQGVVGGRIKEKPSIPTTALDKVLDG